MPPTSDPPNDASATPGARRVAAILAADMVGYSARMEADEAEAVVALAGLRDRIYDRYRLLALFNPPAKVLWRDRRFMMLMRDVGLVAYWRSSGHWPDFCRETDLGYDCKAEADRLLPVV